MLDLIAKFVENGLDPDSGYPYIDTPLEHPIK